MIGLRPPPWIILDASNPGLTSKAIEALVAMGGHAHAALARAALAGDITLLMLTDRKARLDASVLWQLQGPSITLVGDDDDESSGPGGWRSAKILTKWAAAGIVHGAAADEETYRAAVTGAAMVKRFLFIETASRNLEAWAATMPAKPLLCMVPRGGTHPIYPGKGAQH